MRMLLLWATDRATDQLVLIGKQLHLLPSTCHPKCVCFWASIWCLFFQQLQIRLQGKEKELESLTIQIVTEKVISFFLVFPLFSTFQFCKTIGSPKDEVVCGLLFWDQMTGLLIKLGRYQLSHHCGFHILLIRHLSQGRIVEFSLLEDWIAILFKVLLVPNAKFHSVP